MECFEKASVYGGFFLRARKNHVKLPGSHVTLLSDSVLESLAGLEGWDLHRGDGDALGGIARIHAHAGSPLGDAECPEACNGDRVTTLQFFGNGGSKSLEREGSRSLGDAGSIRKESNKILLGHRHT